MAETKLMVWIDQDLCTGDGICEEICPDVFLGRDDGLWVVKEEASHFGTTTIFDGKAAPDGSRGVARVPDKLIDDVVEAATECPGECIMIEPYDAEVMASRGA
ncbi:MAG: ferredoxin [Acidimicrobiia bacterium]